MQNSSTADLGRPQIGDKFLDALHQCARSATRYIFASDKMAAVRPKEKLTRLTGATNALCSAHKRRSYFESVELAIDCDVSPLPELRSTACSPRTLPGIIPRARVAFLLSN